MVAEIEQTEEVVESGGVDRHVGIFTCRNGVGEVVAAATGDGGQTPIRFDEFIDRDVVGISVVDVARLGEGRNCEEDDAGAVAEEVQRLHVAGVIVAAAFVLSDEDRGAGPELWIGVNPIHYLLHEGFEEVELGR